MAKYTGLCFRERQRMEQLKIQGFCTREIARILNRSPSGVFHQKDLIALYA